MSWRLLVLLAVAPGCARGYLVDTTGEWPESYEYREAKLSRSDDDGWTVELAGARYKGPKLLVPWPILILGVRVHLPAHIEEGKEYTVAGPDEGPAECVVELGYVFVFSCTWRSVGPGTVRIARWDPARGCLTASFEVRESCAVEGGTVVRVRGSFAAAP